MARKPGEKTSKAAALAQFGDARFDRPRPGLKIPAALECFPIRWNHLIDKEPLKIKEPEHVLIEKAGHFFGTCSSRCAAPAGRAGARHGRRRFALLDSGQITMRKVDGWQGLAEKPSDQIIDLSA